MFCRGDDLYLPSFPEKFPITASPRSSLAIWRILLLSFLTLIVLPRLEAGTVSFAVVRGAVFRIDTPECSIRPVGRLHPTTPAVDEDASGLVWGRADFSSVAALDPSSGEVRTRINLPQRPYLQFITSDGQLCISHNTLTRRGFSLSVVDTGSGRFVRRIHGIQGLITGFAGDRDWLYVAALGVKRPDYLYLYRIDVDAGTVEEIRREPKSFYRWEISVSAGRLYLTYVAGPKQHAPPLIEVIDIKQHTVIARWASPPGISRFLQKPVFDGASAFFPVEASEGGFGIAVFQSLTGDLRRVLPLRYEPEGILGISGDNLAYQVKRKVGEGEDPLFCFYGINAAAEVRCVAESHLYNEEAES